MSDDPSVWTTANWRQVEPLVDFVATFAAPVPEPATWIMALAGFGSVGLIRLVARRKHLVL
jgi:hypothetical protein